MEVGDVRTITYNNGNSKKSGIYWIRNIKNGKVYVGSAVNFGNRKSHHFYHLRNNTYDNDYLQKSFNKNKEINFLFEILEIVEDKNKLYEKEQYYIDSLDVCNRNKGYNILTVAGSSLGYKHTEETKKQVGLLSKARTIGENNPFYGKHHSEETKEILRKGQSGQNGSGAKLTDEQVIEIQQLYKNGMSIMNIKDKYNMSKEAISSLLHGNSWAYLFDETLNLKTKSKLTENDVIEIKQLLKTKIYSLKEIGNMFNVSRACIGEIRKGTAWKNIFPEENLQYKLNTKLTAEEVIEIRKLFTSTNLSNNKIGKMFNVSFGTIANIRHNRTYKYVEDISE